MRLGNLVDNHESTAKVNSLSIKDEFLTRFLNIITQETALVNELDKPAKNIRFIFYFFVYKVIFFCLFFLVFTSNH